MIDKDKVKDGIFFAAHLSDQIQNCAVEIRFNIYYRT